MREIPFQDDSMRSGMIETVDDDFDDDKVTLEVF